MENPFGFLLVGMFFIAVAFLVLFRARKNGRHNSVFGSDGFSHYDSPANSTDSFDGFGGGSFGGGGAGGTWSDGADSDGGGDGGGGDGD